jgi:putative transposase
MDEKRERSLRRRAIRLSLKGWLPKQILAIIPRSRRWLWKWQQRFQQLGAAGLRSQSRQPHVAPSAYPAGVRRLVVQARRELERARIGLVGARAIRRKLRQEKLVRPLPSLATIKRVLQAAGVTTPPVAKRPAYYPALGLPAGYVLQAMDWTERYLTGGAKVYAFHTLDLETRAAKQTIADNKRGETVRAHALTVWQSLGIPDFLRLDNDAAFNGGYKVQRVMGQFVRLCLFIGVELLFIPVREPQRNGEVESLNGLWAKAFFERYHFRSLVSAQRASPQFETWYWHTYTPPALGDCSPAEAHAQVARHCLSAAQAAAIPLELPLTAGRIHFIRQVDPSGTIQLLNESWPVSKRLCDHYVWATVNTQSRTLRIYSCTAAHKPVRLVRNYPYSLGETVVALPSQFQHPHPRRRVCTMW